MIDNDEEFVSKTAKKNNMTALQKIGERLVTLKATRLNEIPLDDSLRAAIIQAQKMKSGNSLRRQLQYIGRLMRSTDYDAITQALARFEETDKRQTHLLHQAENWRDSFIQQGQQALNEFLAQYPEGNRQQLGQLLREVAKEQQQLVINPQLAPKYSRKLFKALRDIITVSRP
jgi:ribosome-associated protein